MGSGCSSDEFPDSPTAPPTRPLRLMSSQGPTPILIRPQQQQLLRFSQPQQHASIVAEGDTSEESSGTDPMAGEGQALLNSPLMSPSDIFLSFGSNESLYDAQPLEYSFGSDDAAGSPRHVTAPPIFSNATRERFGGCENGNENGATSTNNTPKNTVIEGSGTPTSDADHKTADAASDGSAANPLWVSPEGNAFPNDMRTSASNLNTPMLATSRSDFVFTPKPSASSSTPTTPTTGTMNARAVSFVASSDVDEDELDDLPHRVQLARRRMGAARWPTATFN